MNSEASGTFQPGLGLILAGTRQRDLLLLIAHNCLKYQLVAIHFVAAGFIDVSVELDPRRD